MESSLKMSGGLIGKAGFGSFSVVGSLIGQSAFGSFTSVGAGLEDVHLQHPEPRLFLAVEAGEWCQLTCRHCVYHSSQEESPKHLAAAPKEWVVERLEDFFRQDTFRTTWMSFAGKEPTIYPDILRRLAHAGKRSTGLQILMTNGLRLNERMRDSLEGNIGLFDISLDGDKSAHDWMRGDGTFERTMSRIEGLVHSGVQVGIIATAVHGAITDGRRQIDAIISLARDLRTRFGGCENLSLSISPYYDVPGHAMLLTNDDLVDLMVGLRDSGMTTRVLWVPNYAHKWPAVARELGLDKSVASHDTQTAIPFLWDGKVCHLLFNLAQAPTIGVRVSHEGDVFIGCNHLVLGGTAASDFRIASLRDTPLADVFRGISGLQYPLMQRLATTHQNCLGCPDFGLCKGGDRISGEYFGAGHDPYCGLLQ